MRKSHIALVALLTVVLLATAGCSAITNLLTTTVQDYFPLELGNEWDYKAVMTFYDDPSNPDFVASGEITITLYVAGTETIGETDTYEMKLKDFGIEGPDFTLGEIAEINDMIDGFSVFVAPTAEGLEVFKVEGSYSSSNDTAGEGEAESRTFTGTFGEGIVVLPPFLFAGAETDVVFSQEYEYINYVAGSIQYTDIETVSVDADIVVTTNDGRVEILGDNYRGANISVDTTVVTTDSRDYTDATPDTSSESTVTSSGSIFLARSLGFASLEINWNWGEAADNEGQPQQLVVDLTGVTLN